ncbi:hypothetical protein ACF0H5_023747 [Mactra antiquata]
MLFFNKCNLDRHEKTCQNATKLKFSGGYFSSHKTIFEKIEQMGISVDESVQNFPWFLTFDMEAILKCENEITGEGLTKVSRHDPISASICSNIEGFKTPKFIIDPNFDLLLSKMIEYMNEISYEVYLLAQKRWSKIFTELEQLESKWRVNDKVHNQIQPSSYCNAEKNYDSDESFNEAMESSDNEPPSAEFLHALSKENFWHRFLQNVESTGNVTAEFNDWNTRNHITTNCHDDDNDGADADDSILPFRALNSHRTASNDDDDDDDDNDDYNDDDGDDDNDNDEISFPGTGKQMLKLI